MNSHARLLRQLTVAGGMLLTVFVLVIATAAIARAQGSNNPLLAAIADLQDSVHQIIAADAGQVRFTPPVVLLNENAICEVLNVTSETRHVLVHLINGITGAIAAQNNLALGAGRISAQTSALAGAGGTAFYCKFTVVDGSRTDIRGTLASFTAASDRLSIPAE